MAQQDNIELRSEKVRNIIGQIPPRIIRIGISVMFVIFISLIAGAYFFKFDYTIIADSTLYQKNDTLFFCIKVPLSESKNVRSNQKVIFNILGCEKPDCLKVETITQIIDSTIYIINSTNFNFVYGTFSYPNIVLVDTLYTSATIYAHKTNLIDWWLNIEH